MKIQNNQIKSKYKHIFKSRLFSNMSWLFILNFSNTIIPYLTFPYITRVFLPEGYGDISFALSFIAYFQTFIDYGFNLTGARKIAILENDRNELSKIYTSIMITRFIFFLISLPIIIIITLINTQLYEVRNLVCVFVLYAFSNALIPTWLFNGLQKVKYITSVSIIVRTIFMISVFMFIKSPNDMVLYSFIYSFSFVIIGVLSMITIKFNLKIKIVRIQLKDIKEMIVDGFYVFTSSAVIRVMGTTGIFVLGIFSSSMQTGYYSGISKITQIITMMFYPLGQALYPYYSKKFEKSFEEGYQAVKKASRLIVSIFASFAVVLIVLREPIIMFVLGNDYINASNLLIIIAFLPVLSIMSNFMGTQMLVASGHTKEYSRAFMKGAIFSILIYFTLGYFLGMWGVAIAALLGAILNVILLRSEIVQIVKNKGV